MKINRYWFEPKSYGYGAQPITWEGWAVVIAFVGYLIYISTLITSNEGGNINTYLLYLLIGIIVLIYVSKTRTEEDWEWRWGKKKKKEFEE